MLKNVYGRYLHIFVARVSDPSRSFHPSLMFASKAGTYPTETPFRRSTLENFITLHKTRLERSVGINTN
jgi:hypothetical protein